MAAVAVVATAHDARLDTAHLAQLQTASAVGEPSMSRSVHARTTSVASSSDLSSILSSEDEAPTRKRQRVKGSNTPPTSVDDDEDDEIVQQRLARKARAAALRIQREMEEIAQAEQDVPDRKLYLLAGLYASSNNARGVQSRRKTNKHTAKRGNAVNTDELAETFKFELPMHHGTTILNEERNFRLPWDIQNDFDLSTLPVTVDGLKFRSDALDRISRQKQPPPFKHIAQSTSVVHETPLQPNDCPRTLQIDTSRDCEMRLHFEQYACARAEHAMIRASIGERDSTSASSLLFTKYKYSTCRMMQYFCSPRLCPLGNKCTNTPFNQRQVRHDLEVFWVRDIVFVLPRIPLMNGIDWKPRIWSADKYRYRCWRICHGVPWRGHLGQRVVPSRTG